MEERYGRSDSWIQVTDSDPPIHIFTLEQQCYDGSGVYRERDETFDLPPPDYDEVMSKEKEENEGNDPELPSYETALKLSCQGYV